MKGDTRANNVTVGLAADGSLSAVYRSATAGATTNLIFDVTGYFLPGTSGATYHTVTPGRILDTRKTGGGSHPHRPAVQAAPTASWGPSPWPASFPWLARPPWCPLPRWPSPATSPSRMPLRLGYVALGPTMTTSPSTSTVNVAKGTNVANGVTVALKSGKLQVVWCGTTGSSADVIFDVTGYFTAGAGGLSFYGLAPVRLLDSSKNLGLTGPFKSRSARLFTVGGTSTDPIDC